MKIDRQISDCTNPLRGHTLDEAHQCAEIRDVEGAACIEDIAGFDINLTTCLKERYYACLLGITTVRLFWVTGPYSDATTPFWWSTALADTGAKATREKIDMVEVILDDIGPNLQSYLWWQTIQQRTDLDGG